jgi:antirestriction protein
MKTKAKSSASRITAVEITDDEQRIELLPRHVGKYGLRFEDSVYFFMRQLSSSYRGSCIWNFFELSNGGFYMAPDLEALPVRVFRSAYCGEMSADAVGITACLFALAYLSVETRDDALVKHLYMLRDFATQHAEGKEILTATK